MCENIKNKGPQDYPKRGIISLSQNKRKLDNLSDCDNILKYLNPFMRVGSINEFAWWGGI